MMFGNPNIPGIQEGGGLFGSRPAAFRDGIHDDEEEVLARILRESELDFLREQNMQSIGQNQRPFMPEVVPEENKSDRDQISNAS